MPEMNGVELAQELSQLCPALRILFMSGYPGGTPADNVVFQPHIAYVQKPFSPYSLAEKVSELLDASQ